MKRWLIREYHDDDLEAVVRLCDTTSDSQHSVFTLADCIGVLRTRQPAVVAIRHGRVVGVALSMVSGDRAWVTRIAIPDDLRGQGLASALLLALETQLVERRVRSIAYVLREEELLARGLENAGYSRRPAVAYYDKTISVDADQAVVLDRLGGQLLPRDLWERLAGMDQEKDLIEKRVLLPLAEPELAQQHGVEPPRAIILFGPPGTGKTTFARAIASRLGWPFVELLPSQLAGDPAALRDAFAEVTQLERVLIFIDEVEEIAATRDGATARHGVTNELLKLIPAFRQHDTRLLVCATNTVGDLDPAFLRPGRFDYVLPIGTPDHGARRAIWERYAADGVDVDELVASSERMTPAEIEYIARAAAQASFERDLDRPTGIGPVTDDYLVALGKLRRSVTPELLDEFGVAIAAYART
ncbi:ATP-binding protein [Kribbella sandramycini]|uniref:ATP-binding protein n=1 Tax=Kribbella sandramycini TaxID=60450 RepID=A0A7Y4KX89_9ACTN|nr:ATP-binding protein [Kribbella sandramycini]MBB6569876.1 ribosomal protein S18 acetylase RimI-like enzyme [Kribbella sandramycini]NOL40299.1 ATP-binding protein [Kribbella sandramycini]